MHAVRSRPLTVVFHGNSKEKQEGGSLNGCQKEKVIVQIAAVDVAWREGKEKETSLERKFTIFLTWFLPRSG